MKHSLSVSRRVLWQMRSNMRGLIVLFILPIILTSVVGIAVIYPFEDVKVAVVNLDEGYDLTMENTTVHLSMADDILGRINGTRLRLIPEGNYTSAMKLLKEGKVRAVIFFSPEFTKWALYEMNLTEDVPFSSFPYRLTLDDSYVHLALYISNELETAVQKTVEDLFARGDTENLMSEFSSVDRNSTSNYGYIFSVIMVITLFSVTLFNSSLIMLRERIQHTLDRLISARVSIWEFYFGYTMSFLLINIMELAIFIASMFLIIPDLRLGIVSVAALLASLIMFSLVVQNTGMILSFLFKKEMDVIMSLPAVLMLALMLGNVFYPPESFNAIVSAIAAFNPMKYAIHTTLFLISGGDTMGVVGDIASLFLLFAACLLFLLLITRRRFVGRKS